MYWEDAAINCPHPYIYWSLFCWQLCTTHKQHAQAYYLPLRFCSQDNKKVAYFTALIFFLSGWCMTQNSKTHSGRVSTFLTHVRQVIRFAGKMRHCGSFLYTAWQAAVQKQAVMFWILNEWLMPPLWFDRACKTTQTLGGASFRGQKWISMWRLKTPTQRTFLQSSEVLELIRGRKMEEETEDGRTTNVSRKACL